MTVSYSFPSSIQAQDVTLFAKWTINQYSISFDSNEGTSVATITQDFNTPLQVPANPTRTGYTFAGWFTDEALTSSYTFPSEIPAEDVTLFAKWTINQYSISFDSNEGTSVATITQDFNTPLQVPANPTRTGYTFAGWFTDEALTSSYTFPSEIPAEDVHLFAKWDINFYSLTFTSPFLNNPISTDLVAFNSEIVSLPIIEQPGYDFLGWFDGNVQVNPGLSMPARDLNLVAKFEGLSSTIILITSDSTTIMTLTSGEAIGSLPIPPAKDGYIFLGWSLVPNQKDQLIDSNSIVANGLTIKLYPIWEKTSSSMALQTIFTRYQGDLGLNFIDIASFGFVVSIGFMMMLMYVRKSNGTL